MTDDDRNRLAFWAVVALALISLSAMIAGTVIAWLGSPVDAIGPVVAGAVAGIVAIVLRETRH